jgi:hypothetical protein
VDGSLERLSSRLPPDYVVEGLDPGGEAFPSVESAQLHTALTLQSAYHKWMPSRLNIAVQADGCDPGPPGRPSSCLRRALAMPWDRNGPPSRIVFDFAPAACAPASEARIEACRRMAADALSQLHAMQEALSPTRIDLLDAVFRPSGYGPTSVVGKLLDLRHASWTCAGGRPLLVDRLRDRLLRLRAAFDATMPVLIEAADARVIEARPLTSARTLECAPPPSPS